MECPVCRNGSDVVVSFLFPLSEPHNGKKQWRQEQLMSATKNGQTPIVAQLLEWNTPTEMKDDEENTALHHACQARTRITAMACRPCFSRPSRAGQGASKSSCRGDA